MIGLLVSILVLFLIVGIFYLIGRLIVTSTQFPHGMEILHIIVLIVLLIGLLYLIVPALRGSIPL